jgi:hypothetical protein
MNNITKTNILDYITKLLLKFDYHIRFNTTKDEPSFIKYIWKNYNDYNDYVNTTNIIEKNIYKSKYEKYFDFNNDWDYNKTMDWCLFVDACEYSSRKNLSKIIYDNVNINESKIHWLIRIGDGTNFKNSSKYNIWGVKSNSNTKGFEKLVKKGDILWFIVSKNKAKTIAFAEYVSHNGRTRTNEDLGWVETNSNNWTIEINYENLTDIDKYNYLTCIVGSNVNIRRYNEKCKINLPEIYENFNRSIDIE